MGGRRTCAAEQQQPVAVQHPAGDTTEPRAHLGPVAHLSPFCPARCADYSQRRWTRDGGCLPLAAGHAGSPALQHHPGHPPQRLWRTGASSILNAHEPPPLPADVKTPCMINQPVADPSLRQNHTFLAQAVVREHDKLMSTVKRQMRQNAPLWMQFFFFTFWCVWLG